MIRLSSTFGLMDLLPVLLRLVSLSHMIIIFLSC